MPTVTVYTNAPRQVFPEDFLPDTVRLICKLLDKPFKGVAVILCNDVGIQVGEIADDQAINVEVIGVGDFEDDVRNEEFVSAVIEYLNEITGISTERICVSLKDLLSIQIGFMGGELAYDKIQRRKKAEAVQESTKL